MKKLYMLLLLALVCLVCVGASWTGVGSLRLTPNSSDTYTIDSRNTSGTTTFSVTPAGVAALTGITGAAVATTKSLPLLSFLEENGTVLSASSVPNIATNDAIPSLEWADGETAKVMQTFTVPPDYASTPTFRAFATESNSATPNEIDFQVYVNTDGTASDSSATNQTPVALAGTTSTPDEVTLTVATDFASLSAGDRVTLFLWRDNTAIGTGNLEIKAVDFRYNRSQ